MEKIASCVLRPVSRPSVILLLLLHNALPQMFERIKVVENSPMNTVILDIRSVFLRQGGEPLQTNASVFASEQQTFWPFVIDNFVIRLVGPLDREAICVQQSASHRLESLPGSVSLMSTPGPPTHTANQYSCTPGVCCQLLHVNILLSPTALPKDFFILVEVEDMNDNPPRFSPLNSPYAIVREDVSVGHRIWLPKAFDLDSDQYSVLEYRIENWIRGNHTHLNLGVEQNESWKSAKDGIFPSSSRSSMPYAISARPYLTPVVPLDREHCDVYSFTLIAVDGGVQDTVNPDLPNRALTGSVNIDIHLEDVNDNAPLFDSDMYNAKLVENVVTVNVFEFEVVDKDIGNSGRIKVSIHDHSGYAQRLFRVGLQTVSRSFFHGSSASLTKQSNNPKESHFRGFLQLIGQVDAERFPAILHFQLIATDFGQQALSSTAEVQIQIINVNDNAPSIAFFSRGKRLSDGRISLPEVETPARSLVALMHVTDGDSPLAQLRCQLVQEADTFTLEEVRGSGFQSVHRENFMYESAVEPHGIVSRYRQFAIRTRTILNREIKNLYIVSLLCAAAVTFLSHQSAPVFMTLICWYLFPWN
ncbi:unnamed protein product [Dicrocoelium dendriticum]|nr:unnamed protein product [Dicrocoelium dendriticum]